MAPKPFAKQAQTPNLADVSGRFDPTESVAALDKTAPHYICHRARPCERFLNGGADAIPDYEMLEMVLFVAIPRGDLKPLAKDFIKRFGSFAEVIAAPRAPPGN
jgi:DNA repair protein RadC